MKINKFNYHFKIRRPEDVTLNLSAIYSDLAYSKIDKNKISKVFNLTNEDIDSPDYIINISKAVERTNAPNFQYMNDLTKQLETKWNNFSDKYYQIISSALDISIDENSINHTYCYLQMLPINQIDLVDNIIYLDCNCDLDTVFRNFLLLLTKSLLIARWNYRNNWAFNTEFDYKNKVWMFADLALNAIVNNSELVNFIPRPSYEYFYQLCDSHLNVLDSFNNIYHSKPLDEYFDDVFIYVHTRYKNLLKFKYYLY